MNKLVSPGSVPRSPRPSLSSLPLHPPHLRRRAICAAKSTKHLENQLDLFLRRPASRLPSYTGVFSTQCFSFFFFALPTSLFIYLFFFPLPLAMFCLEMKWMEQSRAERREELEQWREGDGGKVAHRKLSVALFYSLLLLFYLFYLNYIHLCSVF